MTDPLFWHRLQFAFTITYHYLFPQLTMGLALLIVVLKAHRRSRTGDERWNDAARFWIRIFGINFAVGRRHRHPDGVPVRHQLGARSRATPAASSARRSRWRGCSPSSSSRASSALLVWGERRLGRAAHFLAALALFVGSWLSGYFIIATNAFMQHPVGLRGRRRRHARSSPTSAAFLLNPWALAQYAHNHDGGGRHRRRSSMAAVGALLRAARASTATQRAQLPAHWASSPASSPALLVAFPTGDQQAQAGRASTSRWRSPRWRAASRAGPTPSITIIGQPNVAERRLDNPITRAGRAQLPRLRRRSTATCAGSTSSPRTTGPTTSSCSTTRSTSWSGLGTLFIALMGARGAAAAGAAGSSEPRALLWVADAGVPVPVHRQHRGLDDRRARAPAVARLRADAHRRGRRRPRCTAARLELPAQKLERGERHHSDEQGAEAHHHVEAVVQRLDVRRPAEHQKAVGPRIEQEVFVGDAAWPATRAGC